MRFFLSCFALILIVVAAEVHATRDSWSADDYPNPKRDINLCNRRGKKSNICDPDAVLSYSAANRIEGIIKDIFNGEKPYTLGDCGSKGPVGYQVRVCLVLGYLEVPAAETRWKSFGSHWNDSCGVGGGSGDEKDESREWFQC